MNEVAKLADQLHRAFEGDAWHGPSVFEALEGVDAKAAAARPIRGAHSIWELTLHIAAWEGIVRRRLAGEVVTPTDEENFPPVNDESDSAWHKAKRTLQSRHEDLLQAVSGIPESRLSEQVSGKDYDFHHMLYGEVQHAVYHAGQMALLKKARV